MAGNEAAVRVNRAPVLTLWAAVVAERLGHPADTALSLAAHVAGTSARAKARRLGIAGEGAGEGAGGGEGKGKGEGAHGTVARHPRDTIHLLGRDIPTTHDEDGVVLAEDGDGRPAPAEPPRHYVAKAFGQRLDAVRGAMHDLAASLPPDELNRVGFRLYEHFRPEVPADARGWGAKGELHLDRIRGAAV